MSIATWRPLQPRQGQAGALPTPHANIRAGGRPQMLSSACISATRGAVKHGRQQRGGGRHSHRTPLQLPPLPRVDDGSQQAAAVHHLHGKEHQRPLRAMCVCACSARRAVARSSHQQLEQHPPPALPPPASPSTQRPSPPASSTPAPHPPEPPTQPAHLGGHAVQRHDALVAAVAHQGSLAPDCRGVGHLDHLHPPPARPLAHPVREALNLCQQVTPPISEFPMCPPPRTLTATSFPLSLPA